MTTDEEERAARGFGITVPELRQQRREYGQLLTGPYAGCSPEFARMMEQMKEIERIFQAVRDASKIQTG